MSDEEFLFRITRHSSIGFVGGPKHLTWLTEKPRSSKSVLSSSVVISVGMPRITTLSCCCWLVMLKE